MNTRIRNREEKLNHKWRKIRREILAAPLRVLSILGVELRPWSILSLLTLVIASQLPASGRPQISPAASASSTGRSFYVDSRQGNDTNPGTSPDKPWRSLDKVNGTVFRGGDSILLKSGSKWTGQLWPKGSGVEGSPITVDMYGGGVKPAIHGDGRVHDAVLLKKQEYWHQEPTRPGSDATN